MLGNFFLPSITAVCMHVKLMGRYVCRDIYTECIYRSSTLPIYISDQYETTQPIPTYLVAFSVSEFKNTAVDGQRVSVYTRPNMIDQASYIVDKANTLLILMEIYTGIPYQNTKMDLLAVPDFEFGAMENWGLNTYK